MEQLKQYHDQELFSLKQKYDVLLEEKNISYNAVKEELLKVQKYLES